MLLSSYGTRHPTALGWQDVDAVLLWYPVSHSIPTKQALSPAQDLPLSLIHHRLVCHFLCSLDSFPTTYLHTHVSTPSNNLRKSRWLFNNGESKNTKEIPGAFWVLFSPRWLNKSVEGGPLNSWMWEAHNCNLSSLEAEAGRFTSMRPTWAVKVKRKREGSQGEERQREERRNSRRRHSTTKINERNGKLAPGEIAQSAMCPLCM